MGKLLDFFKKEKEILKPEKEVLLDLVESYSFGDYSTLLGESITFDHIFLDAEELNFLNEKGWELISFTYDSENCWYDYVFKRIKED